MQRLLPILWQVPFIACHDEQQHQERLRAEVAAQRVWNWVASLEDFKAERFSLATSFPRRVYAGPLLAQSLEELGLAPQAVLLVQPEDT